MQTFFRMLEPLYHFATDSTWNVPSWGKDPPPAHILHPSFQKVVSRATCRPFVSSMQPPDDHNTRPPGYGHGGK